jgi:hypothetical protein
MHNYIMLIRLIILLNFSFLINLNSYSFDIDKYPDPEGVFVGRISKLNHKAELARIRVKFKNLKFINKNNKFIFWSEENPGKKCQGQVLGKTNEHLLVKVPYYKLCIKKVFLTVGSKLIFYSKDLSNNIKVAYEVIGILVKKNLALKSKVNRIERNISTHVNKIDAVNKRYSILKEKLDREWELEVSNLEEDKLDSLKDLKSNKGRLNDIEFKLEQYKVHDYHLEQDRWALDPQLYQK